MNLRKSPSRRVILTPLTTNSLSRENQPLKRLNEATHKREVTVVPPVRRRTSDETSAVSEILGVTMLLAMVVTVTGGVFVLVMPFMEDIDDNRVWSSSSVAATQLNDRILTVAQSPNGTGVVQHNSLISRSIYPLSGAETWTVQADLAGLDRTTVTLEGGQLLVESINRTAASVHITDDNSTQTFNLTNGSGNLTLSNLQGNVLVEVEDIFGLTSHRFVKIILDGVQLNNRLAEGNYEVDLINGARHEQLPGQAVSVRQFPRFSTDTLLDGTPRVSLILLDIDITTTSRSQMVNVHIDSKGQETLFDSTARNLVVDFEVATESVIAPQYTQRWTGDYGLFLTGNAVDEYTGFGPSGRLSGLDGITLYPQNEEFLLHVSLQSVEVY